MIALTLLTLVLGVGGGVALAMEGNHYMAAYPAIPLFFWLYGAMFITLYSHYPKWRTQLLIGGKGAKLVLAFAVLLIYLLLVGTHVRSFAIIFFVNYMVYMVFDIMFFVRYEKKLKNSTNNETV